MEFPTPKECPPYRAIEENNMHLIEATHTEAQQPAPEIRNIGQNITASTQKSVLGKQNTVTVCQFCHASINTTVNHTVTTRTHMTAVLCCLICCCCCLPYCMNSTKNTDNYCPACKKYLGTYEK